MDTAQWPQEERIMEHKISNTCSSSATLATSCSNHNNNNNNNNNNKPSSTTSLERKVRPQKDEAVNCPRCNSANTKFCYYNNYSLTQPRYFCKTCKRYWTEGGSLRNIPVGGGSRKNKRCSSSSMSSPPSKRISSHDLVAAAQSHYLSSNPNNNNNDYNKILTQQPQDLNLGFPPTTQHHQHHDFTSLSEFIQLPTMETTPNPKSQLPNSTTATTSADHQQQHRHLSALELLNGLTSSRGLTPFIKMAVPDPNNNNNDDDNGVYSSGYPNLLDFKPNLNFSLYGLGNGYGRLQGEVKNSGGRLLFPFEDLKQASSITTDGGDHNNITNNNSNDNDVQNRVEHNGDSTTGYWSGMLDAGGSW